MTSPVPPGVIVMEGKWHNSLPNEHGPTEAPALSTFSSDKFSDTTARNLPMEADTQSPDAFVNFAVISCKDFNWTEVPRGFADKQMLSALTAHLGSFQERRQICFETNWIGKIGKGKVGDVLLAEEPSLEADDVAGGSKSINKVGTFTKATDLRSASFASLIGSARENIAVSTRSMQPTSTTVSSPKVPVISLKLAFASPPETWSCWHDSRGPLNSISFACNSASISSIDKLISGT
mmetsp:Transcript_47017/g.87317  ORF Transcript_47017/g.87317 Transcript_47017/m.87317 type:complete len:236 (+) Transcript_47017:4901-5608(+)